MMNYPKIILTAACLCLSAQTFAQSAEWRLMHRGNAAFNARKYNEAQALYMQVLKHNAHNARATFNLADTYLAKGDARLADSLFDKASQLERNAQVKSMAFHNRGYIRQKAALADQQNRQQLLRQAIELYKQALRLNPHDEDTRYNMVLCQRQLKDSQDKNKQQKKPQPKPQPQQQKQQQQQQQQAQQDKSQQSKQQTEQYINLSKQAERNARQRINNQQPRQKSLNKNW